MKKIKIKIIGKITIFFTNKNFYTLILNKIIVIDQMPFYSFTRVATQT